MKKETKDVCDGIKSLIARVENDTATANDYILFGELSMWWTLVGKQLVEQRRLTMEE